MVDNIQVDKIWPISAMFWFDHIYHNLSTITTVGLETHHIVGGREDNCRLTDVTSHSVHHHHLPVSSYYLYLILSLALQYIFLETLIQVMELLHKHYFIHAQNKNKTFTELFS